MSILVQSITESISRIRDEDLSLTINDQLLLDTLLIKARDKTISQLQKKSQSKKIKIGNKEKTVIQQSLTQNTITE